MTIIFAANKASDIDTNGTDVTDVGKFDSDQVTSAIEIGTDIVSDATAGPSFFNFAGPVLGTMWCHLDFRTPGFAQDVRNDGHLLSFYDSSDNLVARIDYLNGQSRAQVSGDSTVFGANVVSTNTTLYTYDISVNVTPAEIVMSWYRDEILVSTATVSNTTSSHGKPVRCVLDVDTMGFSRAFEGFVCFSQIIVTDDEDTRDWKLKSKEPSSDGTHDEWVGGVTEISDGDLNTKITSAIAGQRQSWNLSNYVGPATGQLVRAVCLNVRGTQGLNVRQSLRKSGSDYDASIQGLNDGNATIAVFSNNPETSSPFLLSEVDAFEAGVKSEA